jgi:GAF domain-containing protein
VDGGADRRSGSIFNAGSAEATLQRVADLAVATIDGCDFAGIVCRRSSGMSIWVHTDPVVERFPAFQQRVGEGPCVDAVTAGTSIYAEDCIDDGRWPNFGREAVAHGARTVLALPLLSDDALGALCLYARYPRAFGVFDRGKATILASLAGFAIGKALADADQKREITSLEAGLTSRTVIGQAQGILMERERLTADQAFDVLRSASQRFNRKLREVVQELVDTGQRPNIEDPPKG